MNIFIMRVHLKILFYRGVIHRSELPKGGLEQFTDSSGEFSNLPKNKKTGMGVFFRGVDTQCTQWLLLLTYIFASAWI